MSMKAEWEAGNCTNPDVIYLNLKGRMDGRFSHFHIMKEDVKLLIKDLQTLVDNEDERVKLKITKR